MRGATLWEEIAPGWRNGRRNRLKICRYIHCGFESRPGHFSGKKPERNGESIQKRKTENGKNSKKQPFFDDIHNKGQKSFVNL